MSANRHMGPMKNLRIRWATLLLTAMFAVLAVAVGRPSVAIAACGGETIVSSEGDLNAAIVDFNGQASACDFTIRLGTDIPLSAPTTAISNSTAGAELTIEGASQTVDGQNTNGVRPFDIGADTIVTMNQITVTGGITGLH